METFKRPTCYETDEDLLREQETFLKNKEKLAAKVKKIQSSNNLEEKNIQSSSDCDRSINKPCSFAVHQKEDILEVQERKVSSEPFIFNLPSKSPDEIFNNLLDNKQHLSKFSSQRREKLYFAQQTKTKEESASSSAEETSTSVLIDGSGLKNGIEEVKSIHEENLARIAAMSAEEIKDCQVQLMKNCSDPTVLEFLQNKRKMKTSPSKYKEHSKSSQVTDNSKQVVKNLFQETYEGEIIRKEGKNDCDAVILEKFLKRPTIATERINLQEAPHNTNIEIPDETKELLAKSNKGNWKNMNKIEKEKLQWLTELPKPNPIDLKTGYTARFDFDGKLLPYGLDIPTYRGLHHHGKEPEIAGYSLEELFLLARSIVQSQRITALHTLAHILDNYWYGMMDSCFDSPLLQTILDAGIVPLLRWALDDTSVTSVAATVTALHSLLISKADEACLLKTFCWLNGHIIPYVAPSDLEEPNADVEELTDADLIKLDVIKGLLRMDILPRFRYILEVMQPPPLLCKLIIEICCRLAQHSKESSYQVGSYPGLMKLVFLKFLPFSWKFVDGCKLIDTVNYSCPMPSALKLVRILSSTDKELALYLMEHFELEMALKQYLSLQPMDEKLIPSEVQNIMIEALKTLYVFLSYGLGFEIFHSLFPVFFPQMDFCLSLDMSTEVSKHRQDFEYASHLFKMLEAVVVISAEQDSGLHMEKLVNTIFKQSLNCLKKWFAQLKQEKPCDLALDLISSALNFVSICFKKSHKGIICDDWNHCSLVKEMYIHYFEPCFKSKVFREFLGQLQSHSLLLCSDQSGNKRDGKTIVSLGSVLWEGDVIPLLRENSSVPLMLASFNFVAIYKNLFNDGNNEPFKDLFNAAVLKYLNKISSQKLNVCSWFTRFETNLIALFLKLSAIMEGNDRLECHKVAVSLLPTLKTPDECVVEDIFENIIFEKNFLLLFNTTEIESIILVLPVIAKCYGSYFFDQLLLSKSRNLHFGSTKLESVASSSNFKCLLPPDWFYAPIFDLYHNSARKKVHESIGPEDLLLITSSLQWVLLCRKLSLPLLKSVSASAEFCYLSMVFLLDEDTFYSSKIKYLLKENLKGLVQENHFDFSKIEPNNVSSFDDLYLELLNQFEAVSYGDHTFGNFVLLPLQQNYHNRWKKILLTDHSCAIPFLGVPLSNLAVSLQCYLQPFEQDTEILRCYLKLLLNGTMTPVRCPLLYLMAIHHLHHFIFMKNIDSLSSQKYFTKSVTASKKEVLKLHILLYEKPDIKSEFGFSLAKELTSHDQQHLNCLLE